MLFKLKHKLDDKAFDINNLLRLTVCMKQLRVLKFNNIRIKISDYSESREIDIDDTKYCFNKYVYEYTANEQALAFRRNTKESVKNTQRITYLYPDEGNDISDFYIYNCLPTLVNMDVPVIIDAPLMLVTSRENILVNLWNNDVFANIYDGYIEFIDYMKEILNDNIYKLIPLSLFCSISDYDNKSLAERIKLLKIFKVIGKSDWVSVLDISSLFIPFPVERYVLKEYNIDFKKAPAFFGALDCPYDTKYFNRMKQLGIEKSDYVTTISYLLKKISIINPKNLFSDEKLRKYFYQFLTDNNNTGQCTDLLKNYPIIPVISSNNTLEFRMWGNIYCKPDEMECRSDYNVGILDEHILKREDYNRIFGCYISVFDEKKRRELYANELKTWLKVSELDKRFELFWKEYKENESNLRNALNEYFDEYDLQKIPVKLLNGDYDDTNFRFTCSIAEEKFGYFIVEDSEEMKSFSSLLHIGRFEDVDPLEDFIEVDEDSLIHLFKIPFTNKHYVYSSLIKTGKLSKELIEKYFWTLLDIGSITIEDLEIWNTNHNSSLCVKATTADEISKVSFYSSKVDFIGFEFADYALFQNFDRYDIIEELSAEIENKANTPDQKKILDSWLSDNIQYTNVIVGDKPIIYRRKDLTSSILLDINKRLDSEIIAQFKYVLKEYFGIGISLDRHMHHYSREGMRFITTSPYTFEDVKEVSDRADASTLNDIEEEKDFLSKPVRAHGKYYGGYAKHCPLCDARVHTELTGFRIKKLSYSGSVNGKNIRDDFHIMCCQNCHDAFKYCDELYINLDRWHESGELQMVVMISGSRWEPNVFKPKLAHQALLYAINKDNLESTGCNW